MPPKSPEAPFYGSLAGVPRGPDLSQEIGLVRQHIQKLAETAADNPQTAQLMVRLLELLTRMVGVQAKVGEREGSDLAELNEKVRQRLIQGGYAPPK